MGLLYLYGGYPGCLRQVFSWCLTLLTKEMTILTQQTTTTEMTLPTKSPSTIKITQSMWWKTMETIRKPTKRCLWTDSVFFVGLFDPDLPFFFSVKWIESWGRSSMAVAGVVTWHGRAHPYSWSITIVSLRSKESEERTTEVSETKLLRHVPRCHVSACIRQGLMWLSG